MRNMERSSTYVCFLQALNVVNAALDLYRDSLVLRPLLSAAQKELDGCDLIVAIVDDELPSRPVDHVTIRLQAGGFVVVSHGNSGGEVDWHVCRSELTEIIRDPRFFLDAPERLNMDWLQARLQRATAEGAADRSTSVSADS